MCGTIVAVNLDSSQNQSRAPRTASAGAGATYSRRSVLKAGATGLGAVLAAGFLSACGANGVSGALGGVGGGFEPNEQLRQLGAVMRNARAGADDEAKEFISGQIGVLEKEFLRQCGTDDNGERDPRCVFDEAEGAEGSDEGSAGDRAGQDKTARKKGGSGADRKQVFAVIQREMLGAIENPELPEPKAHEEDADGRSVTRQEFQTQLLVGLYAATAPVAGTPQRKDANRLLTDPEVVGHGDNRELGEDLRATLDATYGAIQAAGLALAADDGSAREAIESAGDGARFARDMITAMITPEKDEDGEDSSAGSQADGDSGYEPPAGFGLSKATEAPRTAEEAPGFLHAALAAPLSQLRLLAGRAEEPKLRVALAQTCAILSRAQGKLELAQGLEPTGILLRGGD